MKSLVGEDVNGVLLVDSKAGEVYHHLKNEKRWIGIWKSISLDELTTSLEIFIDNIPIASNFFLSEMDKKVLQHLATGQTFEFIQHTHCLSVDEIEQSIYRINSYFRVSNYIESISKATEQNILVIWYELLKLKEGGESMKKGLLLLAGVAVGIVIIILVKAL